MKLKDTDWWLLMGNGELLLDRYYVLIMQDGVPQICCVMSIVESIVLCT